MTARLMMATESLPLSLSKSWVQRMNSVCTLVFAADDTAANQFTPDSLKKTWQSPIHTFFKPEVTLQYHDGQSCHCCIFNTWRINLQQQTSSTTEFGALARTPLMLLSLARRLTIKGVTFFPSLSVKSKSQPNTHTMFTPTTKYGTLPSNLFSQIIIYFNNSTHLIR